MIMEEKMRTKDFSNFMGDFLSEITDMTFTQLKKTHAFLEEEIEKRKNGK